MTINWQRVLPLLVSILILIGIALVRDRSRVLAGIVATMPINVPLALWVIHDANNPAETMAFAQAMIYGLPPTFLFIVVIWWTARLGWGLVPMLLAGYVAWGVALLLIFSLRNLLAG